MKTRLLLVLVLAVLVLGGFLFPRPAQASCQPVYLTQIALYYGVTVQSIVQANNIWNPSLIYVGQRLLIPTACQPTPPPSGCYVTHVVKRGEYLKVIAARYGTTVAAIVNANGLSNPNLIYPGQRLKIPTACKPEPKPPVSKGPWRGEFWNNRYLQGAPAIVRNSELVDFNWGIGSPGAGIHYDNFSARFTRTRDFKAGWYRFQITVDDGVRFWIDSNLLINEWHDTAPRTYTVDRYMNTANYNLKVDYYEHTGGAQVRLKIFGIAAPSTAQPQPTQAQGGNLWYGQYCSTRNWEECCCPSIRWDPEIYFDWGPDGPWPTFRKDDFAVRWTRNVYFDAGTYRFTADVDDGVEVLIDGNSIITQWYDTNGRVFHSDQQITQGTHHIEVRYYEALGDAWIKFSWVKLY
jgi:LysM repeat protein